ncbi:single-stranded DNA-binding protein [Serratia marcescens]|uniref:single-stranded DNA-binding protein n=1 Tax=Serratia marcescens TaxID=615 RepID=UPI0010227B57|nr:single-stranded DNA-binding protein [Serratia marcescens]RZF13783.1 single-stranded DNA-binding protein [Serratia marcescens]
MTAQIAAYGRLVADVQSKTTSNGSTMAFARMAVSLPCHSAESGEAPFWLGVVAFGKQAEALSRHAKGDMVSVSGNMQVSQWTAQDGSTASGYQVVVDSVISARTARPDGKRGQQGQADNALQRARENSANLAATGAYQRPEDFDQTPQFNDDF